jgi:hypothetical protein
VSWIVADTTRASCPTGRRRSPRARHRGRRQPDRGGAGGRAAETDIWDRVAPELRRWIRFSRRGSTARPWRGTPGFIIGTVEADGVVLPRRRLSGARPVDEFRAALDEVLDEVSKER